MNTSNQYRLLWQFTIGLGLIGATIGLLLRYYFLDPLEFNFKYVLHAHSHVMLLGWIMAGLVLLIFRAAGVTNKIDLMLVFLLQLCVVGMLGSFPLQGYGSISIPFSTLHILISYILMFRLWVIYSRKILAPTILKIGIVFHFISTLGPFSLGPMMVNGFQGTALYDQAIFFYLHFQYNGFYLFFLLAILLNHLKIKAWPSRFNKWVAFMAIGAVMSFANSLDYSFDSYWINGTGFTGAALQLTALVMLFKDHIRTRQLRMFRMFILTLILKLALQLLGSLPSVGDLVSNNRFLLIAFLHFIFLGLYTPFIWRFVLPQIRLAENTLKVYWVFFFITEACLLTPSLGIIGPVYQWPLIIFLAYTGLVATWYVMAIFGYRSNSVIHTDTPGG